jgi:hypothetical protein
LIFAVLASAAPSFASPIWRCGEPLHLRVAGRSQAGRGLRPDPQGWRVQIAAPDAVIELSDVTAASPNDRWVVAVADGRALLDIGRFRAGHAYRFEVRHGAHAIDSGYVYLYPPHGKTVSRVAFGASDAPQTEDGIAIAPKSAL